MTQQINHATLYPPQFLHPKVSPFLYDAKKYNTNQHLASSLFNADKVD